MGLNACKAYEEGNFPQAMEYLLQILDMEPQNWLARFYLAVCYEKTGQAFAATRAFRFLYDNCKDDELRKKALFCMQRINGDIQKAAHEDAPEFGRYNGQPGVKLF